MSERKKEKLPAGLRWRGDTIHLKKRYRGVDITGSTHTDDVDTAMEVLASKIREIHDYTLYGKKKERTFEEAVVEYLERVEQEMKHNPDAYRSIDKIKGHLTLAVTVLSDTQLSSIHDGLPAVRGFIADRKEAGCANKTVNHTLAEINKILKQATRWMDEDGDRWLQSYVPLSLLDAASDKVPPYPITWREEKKLLSGLDSAAALADAVVFALYTGAREQEVCGLRWEWEYHVPEIHRSVFLIPSEYVKNKKNRLLVLNDTAHAVVESHRSNGSQYVFPNGTARRKNLRSPAWYKAWKEASLPTTGYKKGVHNLRHTFGRRLSAVGCPWQERKVLMGHAVGDVTDLYSPAQIEQLFYWTQKLDTDRKELSMIRPIRRVV